MTFASVLSLLFIVVTAIFLYRKLNPPGILIASGVAMLAAALLLGVKGLDLAKPTGSAVFDLFKAVEETFLSNLSRAGLMIMTIGGYVAFMNRIQATNALVYVSMKPLSIFRKYPYLAATVTIPIGQLLFITTPSAAGLGLLLVASIYPVLVNLGVSRLTALSVISAATIFDQGPGSANTALAAELIDKTNVFYFITHQLPLVLPTTCVVMLLYYFNNRYFDRKEQREQARGAAMAENAAKAGASSAAAVETKATAGAGTEAAPGTMAETAVETVAEAPTEGKTKAAGKAELPDPSSFRVDVPLIFAVLPMLPLIILIVFSPYMGLFDPPIWLNTTTAMLFSLCVSVLFIGIYYRSLKRTFEALASFWKGMGNVFTSVVTLIVAAEVFSKGLISLGFIDSLVAVTTHLGLSGIGISAVITAIVFGAAMLMGSGNAAFFSFGPLLPGIAAQLGLPAHAMVLPMQLSASMGRAASPIAGIIVAVAGVAGVSPIELAKRNTLPLVGGALFLVIYHFITL